MVVVGWVSSCNLMFLVKIGSGWEVVCYNYIDFFVELFAQIGNQPNGR